MPIEGGSIYQGHCLSANRNSQKSNDTVGWF